MLLALACALAMSCGVRDEAAGEGEGASVRVSNQRMSAPVVYVACGDSTGAGVGARQGGGYAARLFARIERERPGSRLLNFSVSGATTADVLRAQIPRLRDARPTLITVGIGLNDATRGVTTEQFASNYNEIATRIKAATDAPIVVTNLPDISFAPQVPLFLRDELRARIIAFNERIAEVAARHGLILVDAYATSHEAMPAHPEYFSADGFHPSAEGYEFWAETMWPAVRHAIGE